MRSEQREKAVNDTRHGEARSAFPIPDSRFPIPGSRSEPK